MNHTGESQLGSNPNKIYKHKARPLRSVQTLIYAFLTCFICTHWLQIIQCQQILTDQHKASQSEEFDQLQGRRLEDRQDVHLDMAKDELLNDNENMILKGSTGDYNFEHDKALSDNELNKMSTGDWKPPDNLPVALTEEEKENIKIRIIRGDERLKLLSVYPRGGPLYGTTKVTIRADGFEEYSEIFATPKCRFGSNQFIVDATWIKCTKSPRGFYEAIKGEQRNYTCIMCDESPMYPHEEIINLYVSLTGNFDDIYTSLPYRYYQQVEIDSIYPAYGPKDGGTVVQVWGKNFLDLGDDFRCNFGTRSTKAHMINRNQIWCPSAESDIVQQGMPFSVSLNRQQQSIQQVYYYYYNDPNLAKLLPNWGPAVGGTNVTLKGSGFKPFDWDEVDNRVDTMCDWGILGKRMAKVVSSTTAYCVSPANSGLENEIQLTLTLNNQNITNNLTFYYFNPPKIIEVEPVRGPVHGNTTIHIYGTRYVRNRKIICVFDQDQIVKARYVSYTHITCVSPPAKNGPGFVKFNVKYEDDIFSSDYVDFYYFHATHITSGPFPSCGPIQGGTEIMLTGEAFTEPRFGVAKCVFNQTYYTNATVVSNTTLYCDTPELYMDDDAEEMVYNLYVSLDGENFSDDYVQFRYYDDLSVKQVSPYLGPVQGGTLVTVSGDHLNHQNICNLTVKFGINLVNSTSFNMLGDGSIQFEAPPANIPGSAVVEVSGNGQQFTRDLTLHFRDVNNTFEYYQDFLVTYINPPAVSNRGNAKITLKGMLFDQFQVDVNQSVLCRFVDQNNPDVQYGAAGEMKRIGDHEMNCIAPRTDKDGYSKLQISANGQDWQDLNKTVQVFKGPYIREIWPTYVVTRNPQNKSLIVSGENFACTDKCINAKCRFTTKRMEEIFMPARVLYNGSLSCLIPEYTSPEMLSVDVTFNGQEYTNDNFQFGYLDPYVLDVKPRLVSAHGSTKLTLYGYGMLPIPGAHFDVVYKYENQLLLCPNAGRCQKRCFVKGQKICMVDTFPKEDMMRHNHTTLGHAPFHVDIRNPDVDYVPDDIEMLMSKYQGDDTKSHYPILNLEKPMTLRTNFSWYDGSLWNQYSHMNNFSCHFEQGKDSNFLILGSAPMEDGQVEFQKKKLIDVWYYKDLDFYNISTGYAYLNEEKPIVINTEFFWDEENDYYSFRKYANFSCRWTSDNSGLYKNTPAMMESIPVGSYIDEAYPSQIRCKTPRWPHIDKLKLDITINGQDYMHVNYVQLVDELKSLRLAPMAGPIMGGTNVTVWGTGFLSSKPIQTPLFIKFGNLEYVQMNKDNVEEVQFNSKDYYYDDLKMHPFRLRPAISKMEHMKEGNNYMKYQYVTTPDLRHNFHRSKNKMDIWIKQRGGPVMVQIGEILTMNVTDQMKSHLDTFKSEVPMDMETGFKMSTTQLEFYYYRQPIVKKIEPLLGLTEGGTPLSITGAWFDEKPEYGVFPFCRIGGKLGKAKFYSSTRIVCYSPKQTIIDESLRIEVSLNGYDFTDTRFKFNYYQIPVLKDVLPKSGPVTGGSNIWLKGDRFATLSQGSLKKVKCRFTEILPDDATEEQIQNVKIKYIPAYPVDNETMKCTTPPGFKGGDQVWIDMTFNGADYTATRVKFDFFAIFGSFPKSGPNDAYNGFIQIRGEGFRDQMKIICNINNTYVLPLAVHWNIIKCPMLIDYVDLSKGPGEKRRLEVAPGLEGLDSEDERRNLAINSTIVIDENNRPRFQKKFSAVDDDDYGFGNQDDQDDGGPQVGYRSVPFSIVIDAYQRKFGQFVYYKQITVDNVSPLLAPNQGGGEIYIEGKGYNTFFRNSKLSCRIGNELGVAKMVDTNTMKCILSNSLPLLDEGQTLRVSASLNQYTWAESSFSLETYGIEGIYPNAGPYTKATNIYIVGKGFNNEMSGNARCRFGIPGHYQILDGIVLDNEHMYCHLPAGFINFPSGSKPEGILTPLSIAFQDDKYYPYTGGNWTYRTYQQPLLVDAYPTTVVAGKTTKVFVKADKSRYFFEPPAPAGENYNDANWIRCQFGLFGTMPAVYLNKTTIICVTPAIHDPKDIPKEGVQVELTVAMNGVDYASGDSDILIKFVGSDQNQEMIPMVYLITFLSVVLFILLFTAIIVFCFGLKKMYVARSQHSEAVSARDSRILAESMRGSALNPPNIDGNPESGEQQQNGSLDDVKIEKSDGTLRSGRGIFGRRKKD